MRKPSNKNVSEYRELKNIDVDAIKRILDAKQKFETKKHEQKKELTTLRGEVTISLLETKDRYDEKQHKRRLELRGKDRKE